MNLSKLPNAAASVITVTTTATSLYSLINTAAGVQGFVTPANGLDALDITVESGDIRILCDGNAPTSAAGFLLKSGKTTRLRGMPLSKMQLISASGASQTASLIIGVSTLGDQSESSG